MEEENIFDDAEVKEELGEEYSPDEETEEDSKEWVPKISKESPKDKTERLGVKKDCDGKTLTVKSYFFTRPKTMTKEGVKIEPKKAQKSDALYYSGKFGVRFEDNLVEYYPSFNYFVNEDGTINKYAKVNRDGESALTKLFNLIVKKMDKPVDEISDAEAFDFLVGKKVKIQTVKGKYLGKEWFRNDIVEIL